MAKQILYKTAAQRATIKQAWHHLNELLMLIRDHATPWISLLALEAIAEQYISKHTLKGSFKGYHWFPANLCLSVNECVVHGIPDAYILKNGDLLKIDAGITYKGCIADSAISMIVGGDDKNPQGAELIKVTKESLDLWLQHIKAGNTMYAFGETVHTHLTANWFEVIKNLTGHGVGLHVHEGPAVYNRPYHEMKQQRFEEGMVLALEPITSIRSDSFVEDKKNGRNLYTRYGDLGAQWEYTIAVTATWYEILAGITNV